MKRKIIELGKNCLVVSLPSKWAKHQNLKKGDEIEINEDGSRLIIGSKKKDVLKKTEIEIPKGAFTISRYLGAAYHAGYDEVRLNFSEPKTMQDIQKAANEMLGYEIVDHGRNFCILRSVASGLEQEFDTMLRRAFFVTKTMAENSLEAIKKSDYHQIEETTILEKTNNKLTNFCRRVINKTDYSSTNNGTELYVFVYELEKIADEYKYICQYICSHRIKACSKVINLYEQVNKALDLLEKAFYNFKNEYLDEIAELRKKIMDGAGLLYKSVDKREVKIVTNLVNITQLIFNMVGCKLRLVI